MSYQGPIEEMFPGYKWPLNILKPLPTGNFVTRNLSVLLLTVALLGTVARLVATPSMQQFSILITVILILFVDLWRRTIRERVEVNEDGVIIQNFWFSRKLLKWTEVVDSALQTDDDVKSFVIALDTNWVRANTTGMQDTAIVLSETTYGDNIERFQTEFQMYFKKQTYEKNTLNERLRRQVRNAWQNRTKRMLLNVIDDVSLAIFYSIIIDVFTRSVFGFSFGILIYTVLNSIYLLFLVIAQWLVRPYSIVAFRPNEVEALQYLPDDIVTNIRFVVMCNPYSLKLKSCEIIYTGEHYGQTSRFIQIHPQEIPAGELKLGVAQITGNHTKADGVKFTYIMQDHEFTTEIYFH